MSVCVCLSFVNCLSSCLLFYDVRFSAIVFSLYGTLISSPTVCLFGVCIYDCPDVYFLFFLSYQKLFSRYTLRQLKAIAIHTESIQILQIFVILCRIIHGTSFWVATHTHIHTIYFHSHPVHRIRPGTSCSISYDRRMESQENMHYILYGFEIVSLLCMMRPLFLLYFVLFALKWANNDSNKKAAATILRLRNHV